MNTTLYSIARSALALLASILPLTAQTAVPAAAPLQPDEVAARGKGSVLSFADLNEALLFRYGRSETGKQTLQHLLEAGILPVLARENGLEITEAEVEARWHELDAEIRGSGQANGLAGYLAQSKVSSTEFREHLKLSIVHETLARRDLNIPEARAINAEQLQNWMNAMLTKREMTAFAPPWKDGIVARCSGLAVTVDEFVEQLQNDIPSEELETLCYQLLLARRTAERMPDLTAEAKSAALEEEIERRRASALLNPSYQGIPFEQIMAAQGVDITKLHLDPAIQVSAWAHLWVNRKYDDDAMRTAYQEDRKKYDQVFGEAIETWVHFIRAAEVKTPRGLRTFEDALLDSTRLRKNITSLAQFQYEIRRSSEHDATREKEGFWGWITAGAPAYDEAARKEIFDALRSGRYDPNSKPGDAKARLLGPVRTTSGVILMWLGDRRPAPTWNEMKTHVHSELRRHFMDEVLPTSAVHTWRDE